jgi:hypothetical protein
MGAHSRADRLVKHQGVGMGVHPHLKFVPASPEIGGLDHGSLNDVGATAFNALVVRAH